MTLDEALAYYQTKFPNDVIGDGCALVIKDVDEDTLYEEDCRCIVDETIGIDDLRDREVVNVELDDNYYNDDEDDDDAVIKPSITITVR